MYLVVGFNPSEKYESQLGSLFPTEWKKTKMFQTTNQVWMINFPHNPPKKLEKNGDPLVN